MMYKVLNLDGTPCHGGCGTWFLPVGDELGAWMPEVVGVTPCERGYHLCRDARDLVPWLGPAVWEAEGAGERVDCADKVVFSRARLLRRLTTWNDRTARLFAADCAEHVLPAWERAYPDDPRPRRTIEAARAFAWGLIDDAAASAVWSAAWSAARSAAWSAAESAARSAAWSAAESAARSAAWSAAWRAARNAVESAAWSAAWSAAESAELAWQAERLEQYLQGEVT